MNREVNLLEEIAKYSNDFEKYCTLEFYKNDFLTDSTKCNIVYCLKESPYTIESLEKVCNFLKIESPETREKFRNHLAIMASYYNGRKNYHSNYLSVSKQNKLLKKLNKKALEMAMIFEEISKSNSINERLYDAALEINQQVTTERVCSYEGRYYEYNYTPEVSDWVDVPKSKKCLKIINMWKDKALDWKDFWSNFKRADYFKRVADIAALALLNGGYDDDSKKSHALYNWTLNLSYFWKENFNEPFTYKRETGIGHVSKALEALMMLIKPLDPKVNEETMAYVLRLVITDTNKSHNGKCYTK